MVPSERSEVGVQKFCKGIKLITCDVWQSITSISSHSFEAGGLKFGMHDPHINGPKSTKQNFDILSRSWDI